MFLIKDHMVDVIMIKYIMGDKVILIKDIMN